MRKLFAIGLLLAGCCLTGLGNAQEPKIPSSAPAATPEAQKGRLMLERMIAALGGQAYLNFGSRSEQGRVYSFYHDRPSGLGVEFWSLWQYPDKLRTEVGKKRDVAYVFNGNQGYEITFREPPRSAKKNWRTTFAAVPTRWR